MKKFIISVSLILMTFSLSAQIGSSQNYDPSANPMSGWYGGAMSGANPATSPSSTLPSNSSTPTTTVPQEQQDITDTQYDLSIGAPVQPQQQNAPAQPQQQDRGNFSGGSMGGSTSPSTIPQYAP
jgi:hypothetical protein